MNDWSEIDAETERRHGALIAEVSACQSEDALRALIDRKGDALRPVAHYVRERRFRLRGVVSDPTLAA